MKRIFSALCFSMWSTLAFANVPCTLPFTLVNGTTADASQVMANYNALVSCLGNAALAGANADITSLSALTTPIAPVAGGTILFNAGTSAGSANAQTIASTIPSNFSLTNNYTVIFKAGFANTGPMTLNVNATGAINVFKQSGIGPIALQGGEIVNGQVVEVRYDGTQYELVSSLIKVVGGAPSAIGSTTAFYNPTFNATNTVGQIVKMNRLQVDLEQLEGTQFPQSPQSWVSSFYIGGDVNVFASIAATSTIGGYPIAASTRTSDFRTAFSSASGGSGSYFLAVNDDTGAGSPIASAMNVTAWRNASVTGITQAQQTDINNAGTVVDATTGSSTPAGATIGMNFTSGAQSVSLNNASAAIVINAGNNRFRRGIVCGINALDTSVGSTTNGVCIEMGQNQEILWRNATGTVVGELAAGASGIAISAMNLINNVPVVSCAAGTVNTATMVITQGFVTHC